MNYHFRKIQGQRVAIDTMAFIYAFEEHAVYLPILKGFFADLEEGKFEAVTSTLTVTECLVLPYRKKDWMLASRYLFLFRNFPHLSILPVTENIADRAAWLRAEYQLKTPDAIQLATAWGWNSKYFITNDERLPSIKELQVLLLDQFIPHR
jgi:predicted nucleic acid-binding protein